MNVRHLRDWVPVTAALMFAAAAPRTPGPDAAQDGDAWTQVAGGPGTECALGTPFSFFVHMGDPQRLMIFFEGAAPAGTVTRVTSKADVHSIRRWTPRTIRDGVAVAWQT